MVKGDADSVAGEKEKWKRNSKRERRGQAGIMELALASILVIRLPSLKIDNISFFSL